METKRCPTSSPLAPLDRPDMTIRQRQRAKKVNRLIVDTALVFSGRTRGCSTIRSAPNRVAYQPFLFSECRYAPTLAAMQEQKVDRNTCFPPEYKLISPRMAIVHSGSTCLKLVMAQTIDLRSVKSTSRFRDVSGHWTPTNGMLACMIEHDTLLACVPNYLYESTQKRVADLNHRQPKIEKRGAVTSPGTEAVVENRFFAHR